MTSAKAATKSTANTAKITLTEAVAIPFDKLALSQANVRRIAQGMSIECGFRRKPATHSDAKPANVPI